MTEAAPAAKGRERRLFELLETGRLRGWNAVVQGALIILILANVVSVVLETVEPLAHAHARLFHRFELFSGVIFIAEYIARLYSCTGSPREEYHRPVLGRLRFALTPMALIDLVAIIPSLALVFTGIDIGSLRIVRVLRVLKLMRYSPAMATLGRVLYNERKSLGGALVLFNVLLLLASTVAYYAERAAQPVAFGSIPAAMWWAMSALTTVGYGDVTPITALGKVVGSMVTLLGIVVIALPTGIVASSFIEEAKRRDFVVTWSLLSDVPFFQQLRASRIADLVRVLRPRFSQAGELIVRRGDDGDSMFIIASGEVEVELGPDRDPVILEQGQFFGELALIERAPRSATVRAFSDCKLLELPAPEFHELMRQHPELEQAIHEIAAKRRAT